MKYISINQAAEIYPFSEAAIRAYIYRGDFEGVYKRIGKRIVISTEKFDEWIENGGVLNDQRTNS